MRNRILIVDDEYDTTEILRYNLQKAGYDTLVVHNGEEAVRAVQDYQPDLVLLDIMMPELNGWDVCRIIRESPKVKSVPIIMLTALVDEDSRVRGLGLGADDYLAKPFSLRELMLKIRNCLERQRDINMLRTREQEQDTALRYLVHELKNSLNIIGSYSNIALLKNDAMKYLKTISTTAVHAENLLNDASLLSHLEKDCAAFTLTPVTLSDIVEDVTAMFHDAAMSKHVEIGFQNGTAALIMGNQTGVRQVLVNLVSNAVKYNRDNGTVLIRFDETGDWVKISITDEGCGVSAEELPRIFDKFYRAAGSERIKGTGLGLYIVKLLITAMGGTIAVTSIPGQGSTFIVSFQKHRTSMPEKRGNDEEPIARTL